MSKSRDCSTQVGMPSNDQNPGGWRGLTNFGQKFLRRAVGQMVIEDKGKVRVPVFLPRCSSDETAST